MYVVYCRLNGKYEKVATFKTLGEASAHADKLRKHPLASPQCMYYVAGPGLPAPAGLLPERPAARTPAKQPTPRRGHIGQFVHRLRRPKKKTSATAQRLPSAEQREPHHTNPSSLKRDRSRGSRTFGRPANDRREWVDEERWDDIALANRSEEELGLGIPAQRGKGRRNRKGRYIP